MYPITKKTNYNKYYIMWFTGLMIVLWVAVSFIPKTSDISYEEKLLLKYQDNRDNSNDDVLEVYARADEEAKPLLKIRKSWETKANEYRDSLFAKDIDYASWSDMIEGMFTWANTLTTTPYVVGGKSESWLDCSWLFTLYGESIWLVSEWYKINIWNAYNMFSKKTAPVEKPSRWDILYFDAQGNYPNHISLVHHVAYDFEKEMGIVVVDASYGNWVSQRNLVIKKGESNTHSIKVDGNTYTYKVHFATNPLLSFERELALSVPTEKKAETPIVNAGKIDYNPIGFDWSKTAVGEYMYFTRYDLGDVTQNDSSPCIGASWQDLCKLTLSWIKTMALTKDMRIKYGISFWDEVTLEWDQGCAGVYQVHDEMNCRFRGENAHDNWPCKTTKWKRASGNIYRDGTPYLIKGDVAAYWDFQPSWWVCRIANIVKAE